MAMDYGYYTVLKEIDSITDLAYQIEPQIPVEMEAEIKGNSFMS